MSHRDSVTAPPEGARVTAGSPSTPIAAFEARERGLYGVQFHPEVLHTPQRAGDAEELPLRRRRGRASWTRGRGHRGAGRADPRAGRRAARALRALGRRRLGGRGAARAQGGRRPADLRLRRPRPPAQGRGGAGRGDVRRALPRAARARRRRERFLARLAGVDRPRGEAPTIGEEFIRVFEEEARRSATCRSSSRGRSTRT